MSTTATLSYLIVLPTRAAVDAARAASYPHPAQIGTVTVGYVLRSPDQAAIDFAAPIIVDNSLSSSTVPSIRSGWFQFAFPRNVTAFTIDARVAVRLPPAFPAVLLSCIWRGLFVYGPDAAVGVAPAIAQRRWIDGFELPQNGEATAASGPGDFVSRGSSRHLDGFGMASRDQSNAKSHTLTENAGGGASVLNSSWERFYLRIRRYPTAPTLFWQTHMTVSAAAGCALSMLPSGQIGMVNINSVAAQTLLGSTTAIPLNVWVRLDILIKTGALAEFRLYKNGVLQASPVIPAGVGLGQVPVFHASSELGGDTASGMAADFDDWFNAEWPNANGAGAFTGADWLNGSRMALIRADGFAASHAGWTGDYRSMLQRPTVGAGVDLTTIVSGARLAVTTDAARVIDNYPQALGIVAMQPAVFGQQTVAGTGTLGWSLNGVVTPVAAIAQTTVKAWQHLAYRPAGLLVPVKPVAPLELYFEKAANVNACNMQFIGAVAEVLGVFGPEDVATGGAPATGPATVPVQPLGSHNAPYPNSPWGHGYDAPIGPVVITGGTYVGNGTAQDLAFKNPIHWLWIRPTAGDLGGVKWFSPMLGAHLGFREHPASEMMPLAGINPAFVGDGQETLLRLVGANAQNNAVGVTYQYIAVSDPAARFVLNGVLRDWKGAADFLSGLANEGFTPVAGFFHQEIIGTTVTVRHWYKGPGHAVSAASVINAAETATALEFVLGGVISKSGFALSAAHSVPYSLWRRDDGSGDPNISRVVQIGSYIGNGSASRTIALAPASGRRPLFALITPHNAAACQRDPSHTGTTSTTLPSTANAATGIMAGDIDAITVGIVLNANAIVYDYFVIPGCDGAAGNNGWSGNCEIVPVEPVPPTNPPGAPPGPWPPEPDPEPEPVPEPEPAPGPGGPDFDGPCAVASIKVANIALAHIGVSKQILLSAEQTAEAVQMRLHFQDDVEATLRDFPWPFATRYALLVLIAGTPAIPVNGDWTYAYRLPTDHLFSRRIVQPGAGRRFDPDPPPFRLGSDATGPLLYTDAVDAELEYTARLVCPVQRGDALFRSALAWRHAHAIAPALSRDKKKADDCWAMYRALLGQAATAAIKEVQQEPGGDAPWITGRN